MHAIEITSLTKNYGGIVAVDNISFSISRGDFFGFIGPNGAGKTTTIKSIIGLLRYKGNIKVFGFDAEKDYLEVRKRIGYSPQDENFDHFITVEQTLLYTAGYYGMPAHEAKLCTEKSLKEFGLWGERKRWVKSLSGGMRRRLLVARALVHNPPLVILDEPTAGMDAEKRREFWGLLQKINQKGITVFLTSHYIEEVQRLCKTICIINKGKVLAFDTREKLMDDLATQELRLKTDRPIPEGILRLDGLIVKAEGNATKIIGKNVKNSASGIIIALHKSGINVKELDIVNESLEEVFLRLTGNDKA